jgi:PAS domain S-box-containing protein
MSLDVTEKVTTKQNLVTEVAKLKSIIESTTDAVFSLDKNYCYTSFNSTHSAIMKKIRNVNIEIGRNFLSYIPSVQEKLGTKAYLDKALKGERVNETIIIGNTISSQIYLDVVHNPILNEKGEIIGVSVFAKDISESKRALDKLAKREKEYQSLFNADLTGDFISTVEGKIILCNPKFLQIFGFNSEEEAYKTSAFELYKNPLDRSTLISQIRENKKVENYEIDLLSRDGNTITVMQNVVGQFDENGNLEKFIGFLLDITEQKLANEKVKQLSQAVEQSPVTIVITDIEGNIDYVNSKGQDITGYTREELLGQNPRVLSTGKTSNEEYKILWDTIKAGNEWKGEFHNKKKNGDLYWESATISPIKNLKGEITNFLAIKEDITERKLVEAELIAAKEKAEEINKIKSVFFSNMSHEIRTPLVGILGFADILSNSIENEEEREMASSILRSGKRLLNTLTSIMNLSELESLKANLELNELDINFICEEIFNSFKSHSTNPNVKFNAALNSEPILVKINNRLLRESISQIINNAVTYTEQGFVLLTTYKKSLPSSGLKYGVIEITDTGIGIPAEKLKVVFEEFRQASEGLGRNFEGTGLGLTITKKYIELMGGSVSIKSEVGKGTKFTITFPIEDQLEINSNFTNSENKNTQENIIKNEPDKFYDTKKKVLVVENDELSRIYLARCFKDIFICKTVSNGEDAVQNAASDKFDLILMDINLGKDMDGIATTKAIRKLTGYTNIPIIALTAYASDEDKLDFLSNGCSHYMSKPFLKHDILSFLTEILAA